MFRGAHRDHMVCFSGYNIDDLTIEQKLGLVEIVCRHGWERSSLSRSVFIRLGYRGLLFHNMDLPRYSKLPDTILLDPIPKNELQLVPFHNNNNIAVLL